MNNPNYIHTITLYNCLKAKDNPDKKDVWYRVVLHNCFWKSVIIMQQGGTEGTKVNAVQANTYTVRIPQNDKYMPYGEWKQLPDAERALYFTVSKDDIVVCGECQDSITGENGNSAMQVLLRNKPDAFKVTAFSDNTSHAIGKHYRLGG